MSPDGQADVGAQKRSGPARASFEMLQALIFLVDSTIVLATLLASIFYFGHPETYTDLDVEQLTVAGSSAAAIFLLSMGFSHGYSLDLLRSPDRQVGTVIWAWVTTFFVLGWSLFLLRETSNASPMVAGGWFVVGGAGLSIVHALIAFGLRARLEHQALAFTQVHAIFLGDLNQAAPLQASLARLGVEVVGTTVIPARVIGTPDFAVQCERANAEVARTLASQVCDSVYLFAPWHQMHAIDTLRGTLSVLPLPLVLFADSETRRVLHRAPVRLGQMDGFEIQRAPLSRSERAMKRALDLCVASTALVVLAPLMILTALAIYLETGRPILFRQSRKGVGGRPFSILKYRSMTTQDNGPTVVQASRGDARITTVGRVIRRTSIDELPQLFNVLRGEMSIVGPRPHAVAHDDYYDRLIETYVFRHHVKPGITGWAQVNGYRGETREVATMEARVEHDLWYINNWSLWLDIRIILKTALKVLGDSTAY